LAEIFMEKKAKRSIQRSARLPASAVGSR